MSAKFPNRAQFDFTDRTAAFFELIKEECPDLTSRNLVIERAVKMLARDVISPRGPFNVESDEKVTTDPNMIRQQFAEIMNEVDELRDAEVTRFVAMRVQSMYSKLCIQEEEEGSWTAAYSGSGRA